MSYLCRFRKLHQIPCNVRTRNRIKIPNSDNCRWLNVGKNLPRVSTKAWAHLGIKTSGWRPDNRMNLNRTMSPPPTVWPQLARLPFRTTSTENGDDAGISGGFLAMADIGNPNLLRECGVKPAITSAKGPLRAAVPTKCRCCVLWLGSDRRFAPTNRLV